MGARGLVLLVALVAAFPSAAYPIPAFARRYRVSCMLCHQPIPKLNAFGEQFAGNGFRFAPGEEPRDTINTGDPELSLIKDLPLAMRIDAYVQGYAKGTVSTDLQTPYGVKLLSGGPISKKLSYYFYTFLLERGEIGGVEDALIQVNDIGGKPIDLIVGQFQVSDPLFKRELRLEFEDYAIYRARVGEVPVNLTYDRGLMATADLAGFTVTGQILNGNGVGAAQPDRTFDSDPGKNLALHVTRDLVSQVRLGAFGYTGRTESDGLGNQTKMIGFDGTIGGGTVEVNWQYLRRTDSRPRFLPTEPKVTVDGGFGELIVQPPKSKWYGFALYNLVTADRPLLDVRLGTPTNQRRYESYSAGIGRAERRNFRWTLEGTYESTRDRFRWTLGLTTAF
ncbi:MAG: hypothetical protein FJ206_16550 [Gemmatimonadetes bacterium]|nr:hypothetical protein [Gemmatimonadota bacterium]